MDIFATNQIFEFGETVYPNGGYYGPLLGRHMDMSILLEGEAEVIIDGEAYQFNEGTMGFFCSGQSVEFSYAPGKLSHVLWCSTGEFIPPTEMIDGFVSLPKLMGATSDVINILKMGVATGDGQNLDRKRSSLGKLAFNAYFHQADITKFEEPIPDKVKQAKSYIEERFTQRCDMKELAQVVGLNPTYLLRLFKQHLGYTPTQYLWLLRAEKGVYLLTNSGLTIQEIAYQCGFRTPYHFTNHIKKHYGGSPSQLRKNEWYRDPNKFLGQAKIVKY